MNEPAFPALRGLTLRHLQCFAMLARERHFGRAAAQLSITQPALSNAIKQMEHLVGARLLQRSTHQVELTPTGAAVLERAGFLVNTVDLALQDIAGVVQRGRAVVRVGVVPSASGLLAKAIRGFIDGAPGAVEFEVRDRPSNALIDALRAGELDVAVAAVTQPPSGLTCVELFDDPLVLVVPRDHALAQAGSATWRAIAQAQLVLFSSGSMPALAGPASAQFGRIAHTPYRVDYAETLYAFVRGGLALGLMPRLYTSSLVGTDLVVLPLRRPVIQRRVALLHRPGRLRNAVAQAFIEHLRGQLADQPQAA